MRGEGGGGGMGDEWLGGGVGPCAPETKRVDKAAGADPIARMAPRPG